MVIVKVTWLSLECNLKVSSGLLEFWSMFLMHLCVGDISTWLEGEVSSPVGGVFLKE